MAKARTSHNASRRDVDLSARFTAAEKRQVERALARSGGNLSEFVRSAVLHAADQVLENDPLAAFGNSIGAVGGAPGEFGRRADALYAELLLVKHQGRKRAK